MTMTLTSLERARKVERPTRNAMLERAPSVEHFWNENKNLFASAWKEWEKHTQDESLILDSALYDPLLREAVENAWAKPETEHQVQALWKEVFPNVYKAQFFDTDQLHILRKYLENVENADIPLRPPYGISLNRGGAMLDERSVGYLAAPKFQKFYRDLMGVYMRPISRLLFPDIVGYDSQTFGFSIQWQENKDTKLRPHTDASAVTLNINLNLPGEDFSGSTVSFIDPITRNLKKLSFEPGTALIHHGSVPHASDPIIQGQRHNFVLWLYGENGQLPPHGVTPIQAKPEERWAAPLAKPDRFAPF